MTTSSATGSFFVYIVRCSDGSLYVGHSADVQERVKAHNDGRGAAWTACRRPVERVYQESRHTEQKAVRVFTIIDLLPITIIEGSRSLHEVGIPVASSLSAPDRRSVPCRLHVTERGTDHRARLDPQCSRNIILCRSSMTLPKTISPNEPNLGGSRQRGLGCCKGW